MPRRRRTKQSKTSVPIMTAPEESIAVAINQIDEKMENLKKAFDDLQAHQSLLSPSFNLSWSEIDSHFSSLKSSLSNRLRLLQSVARTPPAPDETEPCKAEPPLLWPELRTFCENMDGKGLGEYMVDNSKKRLSINLELPQAIRCSSNPAALVLEAIEGSYHCSPSSPARAIDGRRVFVLLLEALIEINPKLTDDLIERARTLACDWQKNIGNKPSEALGFLLLVVVFELGSVFKMEEVLDYVFLISKYKQAARICKKLGLDKITIAGIIQKLLDSERLIAAISFVYEFEMTDRFRPVVLLKTSLRNSREAAKRVCAEGNNSLKAQTEAADKELSVLRAVIKVVKERKLELEFYDEELEESVQELENQKAERRRAAQQQQVDKKRPRVVAADQKLTIPTQSQQQPLLQQQVDKKRSRVVATDYKLTIPTQSQQQPLLPDPRQSLQRQQQPLLPDPRHSLQSQQQPLMPDPRHSLQSQQQPFLPDPRYNLQSQQQPLMPDPRHSLQSQQQPFLPDPRHSLQVNPFDLLSSGMLGVAVPYGNPLAMYGSVPPPALPPQPVYYGQQTGYGGYGLPPQHHQPYYHP